MEGHDGSWFPPGPGLGLPITLAAASPFEGLGPVVLALLVLLVLSVLASLTEAGYLALPRLRAQQWLGSERPAERLAAKTRLDFAKALAAIVVVNNIANTAGPVLVGYLATEYAAVQRWSHETVTGVVAAVITFLVILFGEILPKTLGDAHAEAISRGAAYPLRTAQWLLAPAVFLVGLLQKPFVRSGAHHMTSEAEIEHLAELGQQQGAIEEHEGDMISKVLRLNDITAEQIMTPRVDMLMLPADKRVAEVADDLAAIKRSLVPLYRKNRDDVVAVLDRHDALILLGRGKGDTPLHDPAVSVKPFFVPLTMTADKLLVHLQRRTDHLAIVVGEYGETVGLVTLEDVIEEIVGEIYDEEDIGTGTGVQRVSRDVVVAQGAAEIKDVNDSLGTEIPNHRTVAGLLLDEMERIPVQGESLRAHGVTFEIVEATERAIRKVRIHREKPPVESAESSRSERALESPEGAEARTAEG
jgi:CBS domain containing-hemolysin-like protein